MSEDQLIFWLFISIYAVLSIQKTRRRYLDSKASKSNSVKPLSLKAAKSFESVKTSESEHCTFGRNNGIFTIENNLLLNNSPAISNSSQSNEEKAKKIQLIKAIINHSIKINSSFLIVGGLSESYMYGLKMLPNIAAVMIGYVYALILIFPFIYNLNLESPYDYLKKRYANRDCVKLACICVAMIYYFAFASLYLWGCTAIVNILAPDLMSLGLANILLGLYSVSGSWIGGYVQSTGTNLAQFLAVFFGILFAIYYTLTNQEKYNEAGIKESLYQIWQLSKDQNRTEVFNRNVDLTTRYTILNQLVSLPLPWCSKLSLFLPNYKKLNSMGSKNKSRLLFISQMPATVVFNAVLIMAGAIFCFSYFFSECDPIHAGRVKNKNQLGILWLHSVFADAHMPALSGVIFASIVYFALIQHSICMSTIGNTLYNEMLEPFVLQKLHIRIESKERIKQCIPILIALSSIPFANLFQYAKNTMLSLFFFFNNSINSPILGLFLLSMLNPYANHIGATSAFLLNVGINFWLALGSLVFSNTRAQELELKTIYCDERDFPANYVHHHHEQHILDAITPANMTFLETSMGYFHEHHIDQFWPSNPILYFAYSIAPIWYCLFSVLFTLLFGSVFSLIYALLKAGSCDLDREFKSERTKYLFFNRLKNYF